MYRTEAGEVLPLSALDCSDDDDDARNGMLDCTVDEEAAKGLLRLPVMLLERADRMEIIVVDLFLRFKKYCRSLSFASTSTS